MQHHRRIALLSCSITAVLSACTMASTRPEQLVAPDASVAAPQVESTGKSQSSGSGGAVSNAPSRDASANHGSGSAAAGPEQADDAGAIRMRPPAMPPSNSDASVPHSVDASSDAGQQPLPECAANFAVEVTACYLLDPTNPDCPRLADHCGLIDASAGATPSVDGGMQP